MDGSRLRTKCKTELSIVICRILSISQNLALLMRVVFVDQG